ncbi:MAG: hypothetical protein K6F63_04695 [Lachnospiraceae bacterium]|nr:hypothetical protein [Lachnospiraceae bacterium]
MKSALRKAAAATLALLLSVSATIAGNSGVKAYANSINGSNADYAQFDRDRIQQPDSALVLIYGPDALMVEAGESYHITQRFLLTEGTRNYTDPVFIGKSDDNMVAFSKIEVKPYDQYAISTDIKLRYNMAVEVNYDITVSDLAKVGKISFGITAYDSKPIGYDENKNASYANTGAFKISLDVVTASSEPLFVLESDPRFTAKAGEYFEIPVQMKNVGEMDAYDVYVAIGGNSNLISADAPMKQKMGSTPHEGTISATFKFLVEAEAKSSRFNLPITVSCRDYSGATYSDSSYYVIVDLVGVEEFTRASNFIVKNVKQSPEKPKGGENVTLTFDLENNGDTDFRNIKLLLGNVSSSAFEPIDSNPYILVGDLDGRKTKKMSVTYKCGNNISGGTNGLTLNFTAQDKHGADIDGSATVYVLNVVAGRSGDSNTVSKPKLMVTDFSTDVEEILAGSKFEYRFNIKNTNEETVARNIKVKVTSQSFSVTAGSNTFFVSEILPGEEKEISINLKASSSLQTGAYPINVEMEYEYDGETKTENGNGVTASDEILLQVNELLRAQCENIQVGDWNMPTVGSTCPLTFEFYNMGRSTLNNVYVTVEGDFELATGNSHYIGNIGPGAPEFVECTVRPLISGDAECRLIIHMEDSNGEEVTKENSSVVFISDSNGGGINGGMDIGIIDYPIDGGMTDPGMVPEAGEKGKKVNVPLVVGAVAAVVIIAVVVVVVVKKKKKAAKEEEFDD